MNKPPHGPRIRFKRHVLWTTTFMGCVRMIVYSNRSTLVILTIGRSGSVSTSMYNAKSSIRNKSWYTAPSTKRRLSEARRMQMYHGPGA